MLTSAIGAGCAAWLLAAVLHFAFVQKYILLAEAYETGAAVHFAGAAPTGDQSAAEADHSHDAATPADDHGEVGSTPSRNFWTAVFFGLVYVAYAMILVAGFGLARAYGKVVTAREGLIWGVAGFAAFQLAPAMGLAPELPGTLAADLGARQVWWWGTVAATVAGLGLLAYGRGVMPAVLGAVVLATPHAIGAPEVEGFTGVAPPEVASAFAARVLGAALASWALLGWVAGALWARKSEP